jgi:uncharacterized protein (DUF427 family)
VNEYITNFIATHFRLRLHQGLASYYNVVLSSGETFQDIVWWYPNTTAEATAIKGFVAFFDEKVDVWLDGEKQPRPLTKYD